MKIYSRFDSSKVVFEFDGANLYGANLSRANLYGADLSRANLSGANLSEADLSGAVMPDGRTFEDHLKIT